MTCLDGADLDGDRLLQSPRQGMRLAGAYVVAAVFLRSLHQDFVNVDHPHVPLIDKAHVPRMPWHDVHVQLWGVAAQDVSRHYVQRWNHHRKDLNLRAQPVLLPGPILMHPDPVPDANPTPEGDDWCVGVHCSVAVQHMSLTRDGAGMQVLSLGLGLCVAQCGRAGASFRRTMVGWHFRGVLHLQRLHRHHHECEAVHLH